MSPISAFAAVLLAVALPVAGAEKSGAEGALRTVVVPEPPAAARVASAQFPQGLTPAPEVIVDSPAADVTDGGTASWGFHVENNGITTLPGPFTVDIEVFGLSNGVLSPAGWTCQLTAPTATCTWPSDLPPGGATTTATFDFDVTGPYGDEVTCEGNRSPCVWFQETHGPDGDRVFTAVVVGGNHAPVAGDDTFYTLGVPGPMTLEVRQNDSDADFDLLVVEIASAPDHGTATVDPDGFTISYVANGTYGGLDGFQYRVRDGSGATDTGFVLIRALPGSIAFDTALVNVGQVEVEHVAMVGSYLENTTGAVLEGTITVGAVPAAEVAAVLAGTGYDPALVAFDPFVFQPVDGQAYSTFNADPFNFVTHAVRPLAPLGTIWLARLTYHLHPFGSPGASLQATIDVVARSATAAEAPIHVLPDTIAVPANVQTMLRPLVNDDSPAGNPLSITAIYSADPWFLDPDSAVGQFAFADPQGPNGTLPYLGILYTPPPGYTGTNAVWYAATEIVPGWNRYDFAKITLHVDALPPPPVAVASGSATICAGGSAPLSGSGGVTCAWSPASGLSDATSCTPAASPAGTTTYSLVVTDAFGQSSSNAALVTVTVESIPVAAASGSTSIPVGGSAALSGAGGASCAWSPAAGLSDAASCAPIASPASTTTYALVVTSAAGCSSTNPASATVTVVQPPVAAASGSATICAGGSAPLSGSGGVSCAWSPATGLDNPASCAPVATPASTTTYSLTVTDAYGQTSTNAATATVTVNALPVAVAGGTATITLGQSAPLTGSGGVSCAWSPASGLNDPASCAPIASPTATTTYALVVTSAAGCASTNPASATITVVPVAGGADLVVPALLGPNQARQGDPIDIQAVTVNAGTGSAGASQTRVYLSVDQVVGPGDQLLVTAAVPGLAAGQLSLSPIVTLPAPSVTPGQYYLIASADDGQVVAETNEGNNTRSIRIHIKRAN